MTKTIDTQITLPVELYQLLAEQAKEHGNSISVEVTALLTPQKRANASRASQGN